MVSCLTVCNLGPGPCNILTFLIIYAKLHKYYKYGALINKMESS